MLRTFTIGAIAGVVLTTGAVVQNQGLRPVRGVVLTTPTGLETGLAAVAGASVEYQEDGSQKVHVTETDANGRFELPRGLQGIVTASKSQLATISVGWPPASGAADLRIVLPRTSTLHGTMYDLATRRAVLNGVVSVTVDHDAHLLSDSAVVDDGRFRFENLPPGPVTLVAHATGFAPDVVTLEIEGGKEHEVRLGLLLNGAVYGTVRESNGNDPTEGAVVFVVYDPEFDEGEVLESLIGGHVMTDETGAFAVNGIVPDEYFGIYAETEDGQRSETLRLKATPGVALEGVVLKMRE